MLILGVSDPGSLAEWFTGVVALAALIVAIIAGRAALQTNRAQQETLALQQRQYEQSQAEKVSLWSELPRGGRGVAHIVNASESPVYDVVLADLDPSSLVRNDSETRSSTASLLARLRFLLPTPVEPTKVDVPGYCQTIYFRDAMGRHWLRSLTGELSPVEALEPSYIVLIHQRGQEGQTPE